MTVKQLNKKVVFLFLPESVVSSFMLIYKHNKIK